METINTVETVETDYVEVFTPYFTSRKGRRIPAARYGLKAFCLRIPRDKYRDNYYADESDPEQDEESAEKDDDGEPTCI